MVGGRAGNRINNSSFCIGNYSEGQNVKVAVVDSDFFLYNEPVDSSIVGKTGHYEGYNFENNSRDIKTFSQNGSTCNYHGRKMASVIFSPLGDSKSTAGIAPWAQPLLFHVSDGGVNVYDAFQIANAIDTARLWGAQVINMSFYVPISSGLAIYAPYYNPIVQAYNDGIILVASTGNEGNGTFYPATYGEVMGVSGHDWNGNTAWFPSLNKFANEYYADIYANGTLGGFANDTPCPNVGCVVSDYGTSGAAALVSGVCALLKHQGKIWNTNSAINKLRSSARKDRADGHYILDALTAVTTP